MGTFDAATDIQEATIEAVIIRADGTHVVWDTSGAHHFTVSAWGATHWQDLTGADTATANGAVASVGVQPVRFH